MSRQYETLNCDCVVSCDDGGGLLGGCGRDNCQFGKWFVIHQLCETCNECLNCSDHSDHSKLDGLDYLKSIMGIQCN